MNREVHEYLGKQIAEHQRTFNECDIRDTSTLFSLKSIGEILKVPAKPIILKASTKKEFEKVLHVRMYSN